MRPDEYERCDGLALGALVRRGEVSPVELVETAIGLIDQRDPAFNAVVHRMFERARETAAELEVVVAERVSGVAAASPDTLFLGVPFLVKDAGAAVAGEPLTGSCRLFVDYIPRRDSELVRRFRAAGLVVVGKTNTPELAAAAVTESRLRGAARNPWDLSRTPGGSSGGSAAAVAARMVPLAHGGDGGGSLRIPGSCCGLFALKPSRGRNPVDSEAGEAWGGLVQEHVLTRSVRDSAAALDVTCAPGSEAAEVAPPPRPFLDEVGAGPGHLRIAFFRGSLFGRAVHPDCAAAADDAAALCAGLGHEVEEWFPAFDVPATRRAFLALVATGVAASAQRGAVLLGRDLVKEDLEPGTWTLVAAGRRLGAEGLAAAQATVTGVRAAIAIAIAARGVDLLLTSTLAYPPLAVGASGMGADQWAAAREIEADPPAARLPELLEVLTERATEFVGNTALFNVTGQPAMSVPLFWNSEALPIGVQFAAAHGDEASLLRLASQLEQARPWAAHRPPVASV